MQGKLIGEEVQEAMLQLEINRMPTSRELRNINKSMLEKRISQTGGFIEWAKTLGLENKKPITKWNNSKIKQGIIEVINTLNLDRFPSRSEIEIVRKDQALHNAICRNGGYRWWTDMFKLTIKPSETKIGQEYEEKVIAMIEAMGCNTKRMTTKYPYDILVNGKVRIDVKVGRPHILKGIRYHTFGINKKYATCDLYVIIALDEKEEIERTLIIPSHELQMTTLSIGKESQYNKYINRWDYIEKYNNFYAQVS